MFSGRKVSFFCFGLLFISSLLLNVTEGAHQKQGKIQGVPNQADKSKVIKHINKCAVFRLPV